LEPLHEVGSHWAIVEKPFWLAPVADAPLLDFGELERRLAAHFTGPAHPLMLSARSSRDSSSELERVIVVDDQWPDVGDRQP